MFSSSNKAKDRIPVHKAQGVTPTERYLNSLCEKTFLSLWSYPGIFRNQKQNGVGDGKELCDMLVVFGQHVLIFSDKYCVFPSTGKLELDWQRWYKAAIKKSADQLWGAERWLKSFPKSVYLDRACTQPLPLNIPSPDSAKYHLIVVAHGSEERCKAAFGGGSGSLIFSSGLGKTEKEDELSSTPFHIGDLDTSKTFVHVMTESTLDILLQTLDTISDFVAYLEKKEKFCRNMLLISVPGEEELLAYYLAHTNDDGEHDFVLDKKFNIMSMEEGFWDEFCNSPEHLEQIRENEISYAWDELIERFSYHAMNATQYFTNHLELSETEIALHFMARESRIRRRMIMKGIVDVFINVSDGTRRLKCLPPVSAGEPFYVFLCLPNPNYGTYEQYRIARGNFLEACLMVVRYKFPDALDIVGIASEPARPGYNSSEDLMYMDGRVWSPELNAEAERLQKELNILTSTRPTYTYEKDYPK